MLNDLLAGDEVVLPMLPTVAQEVLGLCQSDDVDAARLSEVMHRDQSLAGHVLRVANSPLYRPSVPIVSLQQAVSRLGLRAIADIAIAVAIKGKIFDVPAAAGLMAEQWQHALAAGLYAKEVARARRRNVESAFLCGLLHDVGRPVIVAAVLERVPGTHLDALRAAMDIGHAAVGGRLAELWKLPAQVVESARFHHAPDAAPTSTEAAMTTCLGDHLAHYAVPNGRQEVLDQDIRRLAVLETLNLYPDEVDALLASRDDIIARVGVIA